MSPHYRRALMAQPYLNLQMLGCLDARLNLVKKAGYGFHHGIVQPDSLLANPIISWRQMSASTCRLDTDFSLKEIFASNIRTNPILQCFKSIIERAPNVERQCDIGVSAVCTAAAVKSMVENHILRSPLASSMDEDVFDRGGLSLLDYDAINTQPSTFKMTTRRLYNAGTMTMRTHRGVAAGVTEYEEVIPEGRPVPLFVDVDGQQLIRPEGQQHDACITLESAIFPFLFPHGAGFWRPEKDFSPFKSIMTYMKHRMKQLFSPFTLHLPYLLTMYQV